MSDGDFEADLGWSPGWPPHTSGAMPFDAKPDVFIENQRTLHRLRNWFRSSGRRG